MPSFSETTKSLLAILNNINELIVKSSDRKAASDVMRALVVYGKNKKFLLPEEKIQNFHAILLDAKPFTLTSLIKDIAESIVYSDRKDKERIRIK